MRVRRCIVNDCQGRYNSISAHRVFAVRVVGSAVVNRSGTVLIDVGSRHGRRIKTNRIAVDDALVAGCATECDSTDSPGSCAVVSLVVMVAIHIDRTLVNNQIAFQRTLTFIKLPSCIDSLLRQRCGNVVACRVDSAGIGVIRTVHISCRVSGIVSCFRSNNANVKQRSVCTGGAAGHHKGAGADRFAVIDLCSSLDVSAHDFRVRDNRGRCICTDNRCICRGVVGCSERQSLRFVLNYGSGTGVAVGSRFFGPSIKINTDAGFEVLSTSVALKSCGYGIAVSRNTYANHMSAICRVEN